MRTAPDLDDLEELEDAERERLEKALEAITLAGNAEQTRQEIGQLLQLAQEAKGIEDSGRETKLGHLRSIMQEEGFFDRPDQRLLLFTEFKDTLDHLMEHLQAWGFRVGCIHGGMKTGSRDEPGSRLYTEQQFRDGTIQVLVATEAAGEGINLQCCHILFNYDIPWNPNRLEQRMGHIHRYGQRRDCLIFNFVATNTIEGRVIRERLFTVELADDGPPVLCEPDVLSNFSPTAGPGDLPPVAVRFPWHEVTQVAHYYLSVDALKQPVEIREGQKTSEKWKTRDE